MLLGEQYETTRENATGVPGGARRRSRGRGARAGVLEGLHGRAQITVDKTIDEVGDLDSYHAMVIPAAGAGHLRNIQRRSTW